MPSSFSTDLHIPRGSGLRRRHALISNRAIHTTLFLLVLVLVWSRPLAWRRHLWAFGSCRRGRIGLLQRLRGRLGRRLGGGFASVCCLGPRARFGRSRIGRRRPGLILLVGFLGRSFWQPFGARPRPSRGGRCFAVLHQLLHLTQICLILARGCVSGLLRLDFPSLCSGS